MYAIHPDPEIELDLDFAVHTLFLSTEYEASDKQVIFRFAAAVCAWEL